MQLSARNWHTPSELKLMNGFLTNCKIMLQLYTSEKIMLSGVHVCEANILTHANLFMMLGILA